MVRLARFHSGRLRITPIHSYFTTKHISTSDPPATSDPPHYLLGLDLDLDLVPDLVLDLVLDPDLDPPFPPPAPAAAFASHPAVVSVTVVGCAGQRKGVNREFPPYAVASPHAGNLPESVR